MTGELPQWKTHRYDWMRPMYGPPWNLSENGWQMREDQVKSWLGLDPKRHLPGLGMGLTYVGNVAVYVLSVADNQRNGRRQHRVRCFCPHCGQDVPAGRLYQHQGRASIGRGRRARACLERD